MISLVLAICFFVVYLFITRKASNDEEKSEKAQKIKSEYILGFKMFIIFMVVNVIFTFAKWIFIDSII